MKITNKLFLSTLLVSTSVLAQTTVCYKNGWDSPATIETVALDGGVCAGNTSLQDMKEDGWKVADIKIDSEQNKLNYRYFLVKNEGNVTNEELSANGAYSSNKNFTINPIGTRIQNIDGNKSKIDVGNLIVGESGIVVHIYDNDKRLIVSNAKVINSTATSSEIEFFPFDDLTQDALPTSKRGVEINDVLVLNYMYPSSLLIAPNQDTFQTVRANFKYNNFIHSDLFASNLKVNSNPFPSKKDIQKFAIEQNLGTIFVVANQKVHIVDTKTFTILAQYNFDYEKKEMQMPFYTRVEEIEPSFFDFALPSLPSLPALITDNVPFLKSDDKKPSSDYKENYEDYYKYILGLN